MPMQSHSGIHGIPWHRCDRCGFDYPVSQLSRQDGLILCHKCHDNPIATIGNDGRHAIIAQRLQSDVEEPALAEILKNTDFNPDDF
jgi:recombinational DNA repair protein (RecF pathway)